MELNRENLREIIFYNFQRGSIQEFVDHFKTNFEKVGQNQFCSENY